MKLRAIRLENVRRFTGPVEIDSIGDGLNVLSAPNERGKSTFFDALHAVFFKNRKSWDREIRSLVPHAGGDPSVAVEIELANGTYRIEKRWNRHRNGEARILFSGRLFKRADDAEAWIAETLKAPKDGGPAGLLWVRQGLTGLDGDEATRLARRDLLTSVAGEVEAMTGGRRMDAALDRCRSELGRYLTPKGRTKSDGPLKRHEEEKSDLEAERNDLAAKSKGLQEELSRRREIRRQLADLEDPEEEARRKTKIKEALAIHDEASRHAERLDRAEKDERAKRSEFDRAIERLKSLKKDVAELAEATEEDRKARNREEETEKQRRLAANAMSDAEKAFKAATDNASSAQGTLQRALRAEAAIAAKGRREELSVQLENAEKFRQQAERASVDTKIEISEKAMVDLECLDENARILRKARDLEAVAVTMAYASGRSEGVSFDGKPLRNAERTPIVDGAVLQIENIGQLTVHPGQSADDEALASAEAALAQALAAAGVASIEEARASLQRRIRAEGRRRDAEAMLLAVAPEGTDALREQIAKLPELSASGCELPASADAQQAADAAERQRVKADKKYKDAQKAHEQAKAMAARESGAAEGARTRVDRATAALTGIDDLDAERTRRQEDSEKLQAEWTGLARKREKLAESAPDLKSAETRLERARSIVKRADDEKQRLRLELGKLDTSIDIQAGSAVDEEFADVRTRLEEAERMLNELRFEVAVLQKLEAALKSARTAARDRYVEPVLRELGPLLQLFWPEAEIRFDAEQVLPSALVRAGTEENFDILSGGTQEQIALLVRLAFARMLARADTPAPVILDDAIIYTDDDRIERMFDALTRQAQDLQIIVFSCRQKAFRDLGGQGLNIVSTDATSGVR